MAHTIENWFFVPAGNFKQIYPWEDWLNGKIWVIDIENDLKVKPKSFRAHAAGVCFKRNLSLKTNITELDGRRVIILQAYPKVESTPRPRGARTPGRKRGVSNTNLTKRNEAIAKDFASGETYAKLCEKYDLTKSRIYQILVQQGFFGESRKEPESSNEKEL